MNFLDKIKLEDRLFLNNLSDIFKRNGLKLMIVGGYVRDILLGVKKAKIDIDLSINASPDEVMNILKSVEDIGVFDIGGRSHGTLIVVDKKNNTNFEITSCRKDIQTFGRHAEVEFTTSFEEDSMRRDFTMNAIYLDFNGEIYDYHGGIADINARKIRFIGDAKTRITEDFLRIIRYFRFSHIIKDYSFEEINICKELSNEMQMLSKERIRSELLKLFESDNCAYLVDIMLSNGIFDGIFKNCNISASGIKFIESIDDEIFLHTKITKSQGKLLNMLGGIGKNEIFRKYEQKIVDIAAKTKDNDVTILAKYGLCRAFEIFLLLERKINHKAFIALSNLEYTKPDISSMHGAEISKAILDAKIKFYNDYMENLQN
ncbi:tRNA nucleotidyltransferase/poly(A) polymerase family protein [Candidatus Deianiraea vastatrix]|uniref:CCA-adding enzyme n=1 Tax=Candidatus Deianiraea vastatrix TaxID=2163644 RepID=A0A5B8XF61_9RICK|nr:CCA tRNA nucleotidyltransferase [Candidatus Deianiraea vastatrix]QED23555.1 CCA-adding enzyme [Candidatus Deianiraea vastatrix]